MFLVRDEGALFATDITTCKVSLLPILDVRGTAKLVDEAVAS